MAIDILNINSFYTVIEAQILMQEDLKGMTSIQFPTVTNTSTDASLVFGSMTPMIEIPSTVVLRQLEEGIHICSVDKINICIYVATYMCLYVYNYYMYAC